MIEMLTVVGIIAVLVAVSIPVVNSSLEKAQKATDAANERAAKGALLMESLLAESTPDGNYLYFDNAAGKWKTEIEASLIVPYGKCDDHKGCYLKGKMLDSGAVRIVWEDETGERDTLCSGETAVEEAGTPPESNAPKHTYGAFEVQGKSSDADAVVTYESDTGKLTINNGAKVIIRHSAGVTKTTDNYIFVAEGAIADITLVNVNIDVSAKDSTAAFMIAKNSKGNVEVTLVGNNILKSGKSCAGLDKSGTATDTGKLIIKGSGTGSARVGTLEAVGGSGGAGIGGGGGASADGGTADEDGSNIEINSCTVKATGNNGGAGIGGGAKGLNGASGKNITIINSKVTAISRIGNEYGAAGIGGGQSEGSNITIDKSIVTATGSNGGAGIGGSYSGAGSDIIITKSIVMAAGGTYFDTSINYGGAGIGGGGSATGSTITISGSTVRATGGDGAADIGGGKNGTSSGIKVNGNDYTPNTIFPITKDNPPPKP